MLGRQGSGKGTQCGRLSQRYGIAHISTGDLLRAAVREQTAVGQQVAPVLDRGGLVADDLMIDLVVEQARDADWDRSGFVLDGFPRTVAQADGVFGRAAGAGGALGLDAAIELEVPLEEVLGRLERRRVCPVCGTIVTVDDPSIESVPCPNGHGAAVRRDDDQPDAIRRRLALYDQEAGPLWPWFTERGLLVRVDGTGTLDEITERLVAAVDALPATAS